MPRFTQVLSIDLLAAGVARVFAGLTRSVGFSLGGIVASLACVLTLLYSGAVSAVRLRLLTQGKPTPFSYSIERFGWSASFTGGRQFVPSRGRRPTSNPDAPPSLNGKSDRFPYAPSSLAIQGDVGPAGDADHLRQCSS